MSKYKKVKSGFRKRAILLGGRSYSGQGNNPLLKGYSVQEIEDAITKFMAGDTKFNKAITKKLLERLKYATGKLLNSINFKTDVKVTGKDNDFRVNIGLYLDNPELIDALLAGKELETEGRNKIPTEDELVKYIEAKRAMFSGIIRDKFGQVVNTRKNRMAVALKGLSQYRLDPVREIAEEIQISMTQRVKKGKSATIGSDSTIIGYYEIKDGSRTFWKAKRKKFATPLYSLHDDSGEINQAINDVIDRYWKQFFSPAYYERIAKALTGVDLLDTMKNYLPQIVEDKRISQALESSSDKLFDLVDYLQGFGKRYSGQIDRTMNEISKIAQAQTHRITDSGIATQRLIDNSNKKLIAEIAKYKLILKKRRAGRSRFVNK